MRLRGHPIAALAALAALAGLDAGAQAESPDLLKAAMVERIASFIVWPGTPSRAALCVSPEHPQLAAIRAYYESGGKIPVQILKDPQSQAGCTIAFLAPREVSDVKRWRALADKDHVLLVAEGSDAARAGVHVGFYFHMNRPRLEVNRRALEASGLRASFRLLELATVVE